MHSPRKHTEKTIETPVAHDFLSQTVSETSQMTIKLAQQLKLPKPFNTGPHAAHFISPSSTSSKDANKSGRRDSNRVGSHVIRKHTQHHKHHSHTPASKKSTSHSHEPKSRKQKFNYIELLKQQMKEEQI